MRPMLLQTRQNGLPLWAYKALLLLAAAIWGMGTVVIKSTVDEFPPSWIVAVRFTGAGLILGAIALPKIRVCLTEKPAQHLMRGAALGALLFLAYWANSTGLTDTTASNSAFLTTLYVVIIPFLGWWIIRKRPTGYNIAAAAACVAGLGFVAYGGSSGFALRFGDLVTLLSAVFLSLHVLYTAKFAPGLSVTVLTVVQFLVAGILGFAMALATEPMPNFPGLPEETWGSLAYLTVFASCVALGLQNAAVTRVDPAQASLFLAMESVFGVLFSMLFLAEAPSATAFIGFALIFGGMVISEYLPLRAERKQRVAEKNNARRTEDMAANVVDANPNNAPASSTAVIAATEEAAEMETADAFMR